MEEKLRRLPRSAKADSASVASTTPRTTAVTRGSSSPAHPLRKGSIPSASAAPNGKITRPSSPPSSPFSPVGSPPARQKVVNAPSSPSRQRGIPTSRLATPRTRPLSITEKRKVPTPESANIRGSKRLDGDALLSQDDEEVGGQDEITIAISSILSSDPSRSVDALKKIQKILDIPPEAEPSSLEFQALAGHTDGLIETITLQMAHVFERSNGVDDPRNYRLAKHLIQTMNAFCDHLMLAEAMPVDILTSLLEELTTRLLQTDESDDGKVKDLSRFINMIILRLFSTAKRINIFK